MSTEKKEALPKRVLKTPVTVAITATAEWINSKGTLGGWKSPKVTVTAKGLDPLAVTNFGSALYVKASSAKGLDLGGEYVAGGGKSAGVTIF